MTAPAPSHPARRIFCLRWAPRVANVPAMCVELDALIDAETAALREELAARNETITELNRRIGELEARVAMLESIVDKERGLE